jgi:hypothetical protein
MGDVGNGLDKGDVAENASDALERESSVRSTCEVHSGTARFEQFTTVFSNERPHQALGMLTPLSLYSPSEKAFPANVHAITYEEPYIVRPIRRNGTAFKGASA